MQKKPPTTTREIIQALAPLYVERLEATVGIKSTLQKPCAKPKHRPRALPRGKVRIYTREEVQRYEEERRGSL